MNNMSHNFFQSQALAEDRPVNLSRRSFLGASVGALILGVALPDSGVRAQGAAAAAVKPGTRVSAFLEIHADSTVLLRSPFIEGGQGIFTGMAQIVGEELDVDPTRFTVECAPPGADYLVMDGRRFTGGSRSVRMSYETMRRLGARTTNASAGGCRSPRRTGLNSLHRTGTGMPCRLGPRCRLWRACRRGCRLVCA